MSSTPHVFPLTPRARRQGRGWSHWAEHLHGSEYGWAVAFIVPYATVLLVFALYPVLYGLWTASDPALYAQLFNSDEYFDTLVTTFIYVGVGVNLDMFLALLLSGYLMRKDWWIKPLLVISILPWALPAQVAFISWHWMLIYPGFIDSLSWNLFGVDGPDWFHNYWTSLGSMIIAYSWKNIPFWTLILLAGRMSIPQDLYDAAEVDGASGFRRFTHVVVPLLGNVYFVCTLLATIWMLGDFNTPQMVTSGAPDGSTDVLATMGADFLLEKGNPALGLATVVSVVPLLIPIGVLLMRRLQLREVQL